MSWIGINCGDIGHDKTDPRHLGCIVAYKVGSDVPLEIKVKWDSGCYSFLEPEDWVTVERVPQVALLPDRPSTIVESPRRRLERELPRV